MKKRFIYLFTSLAFLLVSIIAAQAQIPTTQISGTQTFTSLSPIDASAAYIPGTAVEDMVTANVTYILNPKVIPANGTGIDASFVTSVTNPSTNTPLPVAPLIVSYQSIVTVKMYAFNRTLPGGKGPMIWGIYSTETTTTGIFKKANWKATRQLSNKESKISPTFNSDAIKQGIKQDNDYYFTNTPDCTPPSNTKGGWISPGGVGYSFDCYYHKGKNRLQPVIVEVTVKNATLRSINIPGVGIISAQYFPVQNPSATNVIAVKGSNYEINTLSSNLPFGHSSGATANRFTLTDVNAAYVGAKFTGLYGSGDATTAYLKVGVNANQELLVALENGQTLSATSLGSTGFTPIQVSSSAFKITDVVDGVQRTFNIWKVASISSARTFKFSANRSGPFIIANAFDVNFKENLVLPASKRKLFHRADWLNDVLICAHRGLWNKVGSHNPPDYTGIAENTIPAYQLALDNGYMDWIEFDARRTSDGVFVAWHDEGISRVSSFPDNQECIPIDEVNARDKPWKDAHQPEYSQSNIAINNKTWAFMSALTVRDYLGCKVKDAQGNYIHPLLISDALQWLVGQQNQGKYSIISLDFKDGLKYLHDLYQLVLEKDLEGQVLLSVYAKDFSLADYQKEYGVSFLRQIALKPTFYEPTDLSSNKQYGGDLNLRLKEYVEANNNGHFLAAITINVNNDKEPILTNLLRQNPPAFPADKIWYVSHYVEPFMASISDNNRISTPAECNVALHPGTNLCVDLFWRADFDWFLNNGTNGIFSDNTEPLIEYLIAKGKKTRQ